jgi:hypothetical protein
MLRKTMVVLATAAALTGGLAHDAVALATAHSGWDGLGDGGGHRIGIGHGGRARIGGKFRRSHFGGPSRAFSRGFAGQHFPAAHGRFGRARRFAPGVDDRFYDYGCSYSHYDRYSCYLPAY